MPSRQPDRQHQHASHNSSAPMTMNASTHTQLANTPAGRLVICPTDDESLPKREQRHGQRREQLQSKKPIKKHSPEYIIRSQLAGGFAGCAAKTVVGPLDRVKILFQASNPQFAKYTGSWAGVATAIRDIYGQDGVRGLFRGHSATLLRIFPYAGIKFMAYEQFRALLIQHKSQETWTRRFSSGALAGLSSVFLTYPLEVIRVRLAFETKRDSRSTLRTICRRIYHEHPAPVTHAPLRANAAGAVASVAAATVNTTATVAQKVAPATGLANFYRGFTPTMWGMLPYAGSSFLAHDTMGDLLRKPALAKYTLLEQAQSATSTSQDPKRPYKKPQLKAWAELTAGGVAGFVSQTVSYPLEVIRRRMQVGGVVGDGHRLGMAEIAARIWAERGLRGFFVGLGIGYVKIIPMVATSFFAYERAKASLGI